MVSQALRRSICLCLVLVFIQSASAQPQSANTTPSETQVRDQAQRVMQNATNLSETGLNPTFFSQLAELLGMFAKLLPPQHPLAGISGLLQGHELMGQGKYAEARVALEQAIMDCEQAMQLPAPCGALAKAMLARLHAFQGDEETARSLLHESKMALEQELGPDHPFTLMIRMASKVAQDDLEEVKAELEKIQQNTPSPLNDPLPQRLFKIMADGLEMVLKHDQGQHAEAFDLLKQLSQKAAEYAKPIQPEIASLFQELAQGDIKLDDIEARYRFFERGLKAQEKIFGLIHPNLVSDLNTLAEHAYLLQRPQHAREHVLRAGRIIDQHMATFLTTLSFAEQRAFLEKNVRRQTSILLSYCQNKDTFPLAYETFFHWKGILVEALRQHTILSQRYALHADVRPQIVQLQNVRMLLAGWFHKAGDIAFDHWQLRNTELTQEKERLERELIRKLPKGTLQALRTAPVQTLLSPDEVFLDIYRYQHVLPGSQPEARYAVVVVSSNGPPQLIPLGSAAEAENTLRQWRNDVVLKHSVSDAWRRLVKLVWQPIAAHLPQGVHKIWLSPDAELARLPWHLLPDSSPQTPRVQLTQIDSARALARLRQVRTRDLPPSSLLLAGGIDFGPTATASDDQQQRRTYGFLKETLEEVNQLRQAGQAHGFAITMLSGNQATKEAIIAHLPGATYIHLATHGFFDQRQLTAMPSSERSQAHVVLATHLVQSDRNPLVESGIVLAGANRRHRQDAHAPGLLTAEELVGINLQQARLVTLSACETGRGEEITGQGVIGLRASVMAAGAHSMLMSLWKVPDDATRAFMQAFYKYLWEENSAATALRMAVQAVRNEQKFAHPVNWAAWILAGEGW